MEPLWTSKDIETYANEQEFDTPENIVFAFKGIERAILTYRCLCNAEKSLPRGVMIEMEMKFHILLARFERVKEERDIECIPLQEYEDYVRLGKLSSK